MNLLKKKKLASRVLKVGLARISFNPGRLDEIKDAITNQDIKDLVKDKAIIIKARKGRKKITRRAYKRGLGKIKKKVNRRKKDYINLTRKLRNYLKKAKKDGKITKEKYRKLRIQIKNRIFKSKSHLEEAI